MTISSTTRKAGPFTGDGLVVVFPFAFKVFTAADLLVVQTTAGVDTTKALTTDYTVSLNADQNASPGGSVTMLVSPPVGSTLTLTSQVANTQGTDLTNLGGFFPKTITDALDRATIQIQQLAVQLASALRLPVSSTASGTLPAPVASSFLGWDNLGASIINYAGLASSAVSAAMAPVVAAATLVLARAAMGATAVGDALFTAATAAAARGTLAVGNLQHTNGFRLSLTTGLPVTPTDVVGAGTIYASPYKGNEIALFSGGVWGVYASAQFSLALAALTVSRPYDVFCFANAGVPTLEFLAWASDTARATALAYQDGVLVKTGDATRRYLGTFYTTAAATTEDSDANRLLWNYYHRVPRKMKKQDATASWTYAVAAYRYANNNAANRLNFVLGVAEDSVSADLDARASATSAGPAQINSIGLNSNTAQAADATAQLFSVAAASAGTSAHAHYEGVPAAGFNYLAWLEFANGGTLSFTGSGQSFISGRLMA